MDIPPRCDAGQKLPALNKMRSLCCAVLGKDVVSVIRSVVLVLHFLVSAAFFASATQRVSGLA